MANPQAVPPPTYPYPIPSLCSAHAGLPHVLGNMDLNRGIQAGVPVDSQNLIDAKSVAKTLRRVHDSALDDRVTAEVAVKAEVRVAAVEAAHAFATYTPANITQALQNLANQLANYHAQTNQRFDGIVQDLAAVNAQTNQRFDGIVQDLAQTNQRLDGVVQDLAAINGSLRLNLAITYNNRIISHNRHLTTSQHFLPLQKTIPGDGVALASAIYGNVNNLQHLLVQPAQVPVVGTMPPNFATDYHNYQRATIINLIIFYNEDFGIVAGDTVQECVEKFHTFLTRY